MKSGYFILSLTLFALVAVTAAGQTPAFVPSDTPASGTCGTLPFGQAFSSAETYMARIPASAAGATGGLIQDIAFSGCGSGAWSSSTVIIGFGHIPSPLPIPFTYPTFDPSGNVTNTGSFIDFSIAYDSNVSGSMVWTIRTDEWSPMGLQANWIWNGFDDVGFYITFQGATPVGFTGALRSASTVNRTWSGGYQAPTSTNTSTSTGLKMALNPPQTLRLHAASNPNLSATIGITGISLSAVEGWTFISTATAAPPGGGFLFGLTPDSVTWTIILTTPVAGVGNPLHWVAGVPGVFPDVPLQLPSALMAGLSGQTWDMVAVALDGVLGLDAVSNVVRVTWL